MTVKRRRVIVMLLYIIIRAEVLFLQKLLLKKWVIRKNIELFAVRIVWRKIIFDLVDFST